MACRSVVAGVTFVLTFVAFGLSLAYFGLLAVIVFLMGILVASCGVGGVVACSHMYSNGRKRKKKREQRRRKGHIDSLLNVKHSPARQIKPLVKHIDERKGLNHKTFFHRERGRSKQQAPFIQRIGNIQNLKEFKSFLRATWQYSSRTGRDSRGLQHTGISTTEVYQLHNKTQIDVYMKERKNLRGKMAAHKELFATTEIQPVLTSSHVPPDILDSDPLEDFTNEVYLFHGTKKDCLLSIATEGLRPSTNGLYGGGAVYLAESAEKADQYTDIKNDRQRIGLALLIVRVLLGECYTEKEGDFITERPRRNRPCPLDICCCGDMYDSVVAGHNKRFREFLVYNPHRCLPQFLVVYNRMGNTVN